MSESTRKFALISPRSPHLSHPRVLEDQEREEMATEAGQVVKEIQDLRIELVLLIRAWREEFQVPETAKVDSRLALRQSPDELMFERLISTPCMRLQKP